MFKFVRRLVGILTFNFLSEYFRPTNLQQGSDIAVHSHDVTRVSDCHLEIKKRTKNDVHSLAEHQTHTHKPLSMKMMFKSCTV